MSNLYGIVRKRSSQFSVRSWIQMKTNRRDHAQSQLFQLLVDAMVAFSSNPEERIRVEENCNEEAADELIGNLMEREFDGDQDLTAQKKIAQFLHAVLTEDRAVSWSTRIEKLLKVCSLEENTVLFATNIAVMLFDGWLTLHECVMRGDTLEGVENPLEYSLMRCTNLVEIIAKCAQNETSSKIVATEIMPLVEEKAYVLSIRGIEELFWVSGTDYDPIMLATLQSLLNKESVRIRALNIVTSYEVLQNLEEIVRYSRSMQCVRLVYELAFDIEKHVSDPDIFPDGFFERFLDADVQENGIAELAGKFMWKVSNNINDPGNPTAIYQKYTKLCAKKKLNSKQFEYMVKACPQTDFFVQWRTMLTFINTEYDVTMCDIVVESVRMLTQNIADNDVAANQRKLNEIVEWLPYFLRRIEPYHALVGRLLFTYVYIDNAEYAVDPKLTKMLVRTICRSLKRFTDFDLQRNAVEVLVRVLETVDFESNIPVEQAHENMKTARSQFECAVTADAWNEIDLMFMRFAAFTIVDIELNQGILNDVAEMCSRDLNTYDRMQDHPRFGYNVIMLTRCYRLAAEKMWNLPEAVPNINEYVKYLLGVLAQLESVSECGFVAKEIFVSLTKLIVIKVDATNPTFAISQPEVCVRELIRFALAKLKPIYRIDLCYMLGSEYWANIELICEKLTERCLQFVQDVNICAEFVQYCVTHNEKPIQNIGIRFMREISRKDAQFIGGVLANIMWNVPDVSLKEVYVSKLIDAFVEKAVHEMAEVNQVIAGHIFTWQHSHICEPSHQAKGSIGLNRPSDESIVNGNKCYDLAKKLVRGSASKLLGPIKVWYIQNGVRGFTSIYPKGAVTKRKQRA